MTLHPLTTSTFKREARDMNVNSIYVKKIKCLDENLTQHFQKALVTDYNLSRKLVSFQASSKKPEYRWYKYKEGFSPDIVEYLLNKYGVTSGSVLDPFAGSGATLFASATLGFRADGIELLPVGQEIIKARILAFNGIDKSHLKRIKWWRTNKPWEKSKKQKDFSILRITDGAYPEETVSSIKNYLASIEKEDKDVAAILLFALLCILESISYTSKDGQCLRWDYRSGRQGLGKKAFNKGEILPFSRAICSKIDEILHDIQGGEAPALPFAASQSQSANGKIKLFCDSCFNAMPKLRANSYSAIVTSPPYCNRYDYTRTYALEHAILGVSESENSRLRQSMITCTVENKEKPDVIGASSWETPISICNSLPILSAILSYLEEMKSNKMLNNNAIPRMVRGYFHEMACIIYECFRVLKNGGYMFMVNDNVRYAGVSIPVDLILSKIAEELGFQVDNVLCLPQKKGNSSQQMGMHGKETLRKCIYVWHKG